MESRRREGARGGALTRRREPAHRPTDRITKVILEHALLPVCPGLEDDFEAAFARARPLLEATHVFRTLRLSRSAGSPWTYLLLVEWDSVHAHTVGFRGSDRYRHWRELLHSFSAPFPDVEHVVPVC